MTDDVKAAASAKKENPHTKASQRRFLLRNMPNECGDEMMKDTDSILMTKQELTDALLHACRTERNSVMNYLLHVVEGLQSEEFLKDKTESEIKDSLLIAEGMASALLVMMDRHPVARVVVRGKGEKEEAH